MVCTAGEKKTIKKKANEICHCTYLGQTTGKIETVAQYSEWVVSYGFPLLCPFSRDVILKGKKSLKKMYILILKYIHGRTQVRRKFKQAPRIMLQNYRKCLKLFQDFKQAALLSKTDVSLCQATAMCYHRYGAQCMLTCKQVGLPNNDNRRTERKM